MPISSLILKRLQTNDPALKELNLINKSITSLDIQELVDALQSNPYLISLNLAYNQIGDAGRVRLKLVFLSSCFMPVASPLIIGPMCSQSQHCFHMFHQPPGTLYFKPFLNNIAVRTFYFTRAYR